MSAAYFEEKTYQGVDFTREKFEKGQYEICVLINCNLANCDLSGSSFTECEFNNCNLSNCKVIQTTFNDARFKECKMIGIDFEHCSDYLFTLGFEVCTLNLSSFYKRTLKKTNFINCHLQEVDFIESDLSGSVFKGSDLKNAKFENTNLEKADFRGAINYVFDPDRNRIKKAKFSWPQVVALLGKYDITIE